VHRGLYVDRLPEIQLSPVGCAYGASLLIIELITIIINNGLLDQSAYSQPEKKSDNCADYSSIMEHVMIAIF
jgi:hypothetical protein